MLGIRVVAGHAGLDIELSGAHSSEQKDPTPWLSGGELLMIDGLNLGRNRATQIAYLRRLTDRGVGALALGIGGSLPYSAAPPGLVAAAVDGGMPLLEVPVTTPFIAITQAVYSRMADERLALTERTLEGQRRLTTSAATIDALGDVTATLGSLIDGWAVVCDPHGRSLTSTPTRARAAEAAQRHSAELTRGGLHTSVTATEAAGTYVVQPLGVDRVRALLVYGRDEPDLNARLAGNLATFAAALLSIELERRHALRVLERKPGTDVAAQLLAGVPAARAAQLVASVGVRAERVQVLSALPVTTVEELGDAIADAVPEALLLPTANRVLAVVPSDVPGLRERLEEALHGGAAGIGGPVRPHHCPGSRRQAEHALSVSRQQGGGLIDAMRLGSIQVLLQLGSADSLGAFADAVLGPIENGDGNEYVSRSLRAYLVSGGSHDHAATIAKVHRHTLRRHLQRVEQLTGRRLDNPRDRTELWLAYEARDIAATL